MFAIERKPVAAKAAQSPESGVVAHGYGQTAPRSLGHFSPFEPCANDSLDPILVPGYAPSTFSPFQESHAPQCYPKMLSQGSTSYTSGPAQEPQLAAEDNASKQPNKIRKQSSKKNWLNQSSFHNGNPNTLSMESNVPKHGSSTNPFRTNLGHSRRTSATVIPAELQAISNLLIAGSQSRETFNAIKEENEHPENQIRVDTSTVWAPSWSFSSVANRHVSQALPSYDYPSDTPSQAVINNGHVPLTSYQPGPDNTRLGSYQERQPRNTNPFRPAPSHVLEACSPRFQERPARLPFERGPAEGYSVQRPEAGIPPNSMGHQNFNSWTNPNSPRNWRATQGSVQLSFRRRVPDAQQETQSGGTAPRSSESNQSEINERTQLPRIWPVSSEQLPRYEDVIPSAPIPEPSLRERSQRLDEWEQRLDQWQEEQSARGQTQQLAVVPYINRNQQSSVDDMVRSREAEQARLDEEFAENLDQMTIADESRLRAEQQRDEEHACALQEDHISEQLRIRAEQFRRDEQEALRMAEEIERQREEFELQDRMMAEELQRQADEEVARILEDENLIEQQFSDEIQEQDREWAYWEAHRVAMEVERQEEIERLERERLARLRECVVCMETFDMGVMKRLRCDHWYCEDDLKEAFKSAYTTRQQFTCCGQPAAVDLLDDVAVPIPARTLEKYKLLSLELSTPNPVYCSNPICSRFLPPGSLNGPDTLTCRKCRTKTCRHCRGPAHMLLSAAGPSGAFVRHVRGSLAGGTTYRGLYSGPSGSSGGTGSNGFSGEDAERVECPADVAAQEARKLAAKQGWKACPKCANMIEKSSGCLHMTCRCGTHFCYQCGALYPTACNASGRCVAPPPAIQVIY